MYLKKLVGSLCKTSKSFEFAWMHYNILPFILFSLLHLNHTSFIFWITFHIFKFSIFLTSLIANWLQFLSLLLIDKSCFATLFDHEDMQEIIRHLPFCHVEAPGQHEGAKTLPTASVHCRYYSQSLFLEQSDSHWVLINISCCNSAII